MRLSPLKPLCINWCMVRTLKPLLLFIFFLTTLLGGEIDTLLKEASRDQQKGDRLHLERAHNLYKNAYLNAIIEGDDTLSNKALKGIIATGHTLGYDMRKYGGKSAAQQTKRTPSKKPIAKKTANLPKVLSYGANVNQIFITFSHKPTLHKSFVLSQSNSHKAVFDINAQFKNPLEYIKTPFFKDVKIASKEHGVRLVLEKGRPFSTKTSWIGDKLVLTSTAAKKTLINPSKTSNKATKTPTSARHINRPSLTDYKANVNQVYLYFDKTISTKAIKYQTYKKGKLHHAIIDIDAHFAKPLTHIRSAFFKDIRISEHRGKLRLVLEKGLSFRTTLEPIGKKLVLHTKSAKNSSIAFKKSPSTSKQEMSALPIQLPKASKGKKRIIIDAGHGGRDAGAVGFNYKEKDIVLGVAKKTASMLKKRGYEVKLTRTTDKLIKLKKRTTMANQFNADIFISIHANSIPNKPRVNGVETYFLSPARSKRAKRVAALENSADIEAMDRSSQNAFLSFLNREKVVSSNKFAIDLQKNILARLRSRYKDIRDGGVREAPFWVLVGAQMPAVLIEVGYISNKTEARRMSRPNYQRLIAEGIANGVESYFLNN